ncbi:hypothetical protein [Asticcacaulis sp.]|uniref:hypothetical protein n=1 Tax=Asticcacaulis sp. TaxID=1872648 RepID=UPI002613847E|nr:hypothetical protein [Asticcacaulis sp.]
MQSFVLKSAFATIFVSSIACSPTEAHIVISDFFEPLAVERHAPNWSAGGWDLSQHCCAVLVRENEPPTSGASLPHSGDTTQKKPSINLDEDDDSLFKGEIPLVEKAREEANKARAVLERARKLEAQSSLLLGINVELSKVLNGIKNGRNSPNDIQSYIDKLEEQYLITLNLDETINHRIKCEKDLQLSIFYYSLTTIPYFSNTKFSRDGKVSPRKEYLMRRLEEFLDGNDKSCINFPKDFKSEK